MVTFFVIGTPIGNLEDVTLRALNTLKKVDIVLCEDTRVTKRLLDKHDIHVRTKSYHAHSTIARSEEAVNLLREGKSVALVSDAGTPGISDPGSELVAYIREHLALEISAGTIRIEVIPGPSALTAALSIAGVPSADFTFLGFLPHKKGRETLFKEIVGSKRTMVFYESPHRIMKTLTSLVEHSNSSQKKIISGSGRRKSIEIQDVSVGLPSKSRNDFLLRRVAICRELTKIFEEIVSGTPEEVKNYFEAHPDKVRGEFVVIVRNQQVPHTEPVEV